MSNKSLIQMLIKGTYLEYKNYKLTALEVRLKTGLTPKAIKELYFKN